MVAIAATETQNNRVSFNLLELMLMLILPLWVRFVIKLIWINKIQIIIDELHSLCYETSG